MPGSKATAEYALKAAAVSAGAVSHFTDANYALCEGSRAPITELDANQLTPRTSSCQCWPP